MTWPNCILLDYDRYLSQNHSQKRLFFIYCKGGYRRAERERGVEAVADRSQESLGERLRRENSHSL